MHICRHYQMRSRITFRDPPSSQPCIFRAVLADASEPRGLCKNSILFQTRIGAVRIQQNAIWSHWCAKFVPALAGQSFAWLGIHEHLRMWTTSLFIVDDDAHKQHLREFFQCLREAGLTLRCKKCHIGMSEVSFIWTARCAEAFATLEDQLENAPILAHPHFNDNAGEFRVHTDKSAGAR